MEDKRPIERGGKLRTLPRGPEHLPHGHPRTTPSPQTTRKPKKAETDRGIKNKTASSSSDGHDRAATHTEGFNTRHDYPHRAQLCQGCAGVSVQLCHLHGCSVQTHQWSGEPAMKFCSREHEVADAVRRPRPSEYAGVPRPDRRTPECKLEGCRLRAHTDAVKNP